jgi:uncharacterized protein (TIGR01777 family)
MRVAITGSGGLVGSALRAALGEAAVPFRHGIDWDWRSGTIDALRLRSCDAVVHLAGAGIATRRWTPAWRAEIRDSRVWGTALIARTLAAAPGRVQACLCASATGWYGDRGEQELTEASASGDGFLAEVCRAWEGAAEPLPAAVRRVHLRLGMVLDPAGGALPKLLAPLRWGLGGRLGDGRQWWSWIALTDLVACIRRCLDDPAVQGVVNAVAPEPMRQIDVVRDLAVALHRPLLAPPAPRWALRLAVGGMADEALCASQRVLPAALCRLGFTWRCQRPGATLAV